MNIHQHARTTPRSRERLVQRVLQGAESIRDVADALGISDRTVRKWIQRYRTAGRAGLQDRSCRPRRAPAAVAPELVRWIERLRRQRWTGAQIARALPLSPATVARYLTRLRLTRLRALEPRVPIVRYEYTQPGGLVHLDIKNSGGSAGSGIASPGTGAPGSAGSAGSTSTWRSMTRPGWPTWRSCPMSRA